MGSSLLRRIKNIFALLSRGAKQVHTAFKIKKWPSAQQLRHAGRVLTVREKRVVIGAIVIAAFAALGLLLKAGDSLLAEVPKNGGVYREAVVGAPQFINPLYTPSNEVDADLTRIIFSGLLRYDEKGTLVPDLAESFTINDKQTEYLFTIRTNAVWHDNEPLGINDILFTFAAIQDAAYGSPLRVSFQGVTVSQVDARTVKFVLEKPFAPFLSALTVGIIPEHIWGNIDPRNARLSPYNTRPIGSGPFKFKELIRGESGMAQRLTVVRHEQFYRRPPYLDEVQFKFYPSFDLAVQDIRSQQVDGLHFVPKQFRERVERKYMELYTLQLPRYTALFFNPRQATALKTKEVRQALGLAIDKQQILHDVLRGEGTVISSPILEGFVGYDPVFHKNGVNRERAKELLSAAGWKEINREDYIALRTKLLRKELEKVRDEERKLAQESKPDTLDTDTSSTTDDAVIQKQIDERLTGEMPIAQTVFRAKGDTPLILTITTVSDEELALVTEKAAAAWREVGVSAQVRVAAARDITTSVLRPRAYDILLYGEIIGADPDPFPFWHSSQVDHPGLNLANFVNRKADMLLEEARVSADETIRAQKYRAFQELLKQEYPAVFLYAPTYTYAVANQIKGITIARILSSADRFNDIEERYIKTKRVWRRK